MIESSESATIAAGFLKYLKEAGKIDLLPEVLNILQREVGPKLPELIVESAVELTAADKQELIKQLSDKPRLGEIQFRVNPELVGGLKIIHGDRVMDLSVQSRLRKIYA
jgi:F-type H+-transporting ATPase subunit delta